MSLMRKFSIRTKLVLIIFGLIVWSLLFAMPEDKNESANDLNDNQIVKVSPRIAPETLRLIEVGAMVLTAVAAILAALAVLL